MEKGIVVKVSNIKWDGAGDNIPTEMELIIDYQMIKNELEGCLTENECDVVEIIDEYVNEKISDISGFCHFGYSLNILTCVICGGLLTKEETNISDYTCVDCDCLQDADGTIHSDIVFFLANYGTEKNIEIFQDLDKAKNESSDGKVYKAVLNSDHIWFEDGNWNYEDKSDLFIEVPIEVQ